MIVATGHGADLTKVIDLSEDVVIAYKCESKKDDTIRGGVEGGRLYVKLNC